jgi:tetratricopeptide (TPR) repeat protein
MEGMYPVIKTKMHMKKIFVLLAISFTASFFALAQKGGMGVDFKKLSKEERQKVETAEVLFNEGNYLRALPLYLGVYNAHQDEVYLKLRTGICYLYKSDEKEKSIDLLKQVELSNPQTPDLNFYLGRAYHLNYKFDDAINSFNKYLTESPSINQRLLTQRYIDNSKNGKAFVELKVQCEIQNAGSNINTENQEYVPVISSDEAIMIFTYTGPSSTGGLMDDDFNPDPNGNYYEDVFISFRVGAEWQTPQSIGTSINTKNHDANIAISPDGQKLFIYHSTLEDGGDIYMSTLKGEIWGAPEPLNANINTKAWEGSVSLSANEQVLYFASERPEGYGGKDIYLSKKQADGTWGKAENLGPKINTKFNDDSPFIHPDGITLYFSSEGHNSIGGYDIMYSTLKNDQWEAPTNLGNPINTTEDERFYVLSADGEHGYFSSDRKGGFGQQDIYKVTPGFYGEKPVLALVVGVVTADDKPVDATINVTNAETSEKQGSYHSNSATGKYLIALTPGSNYKVAIEVEGHESQFQYVNVKSLETFVQVQNDIKLVAKGSSPETTSVQENTNVIQDQINEQVKKYNEEKKAEVYEARVYQSLLKKYGDLKTDSTEFNVEIGTFENASDFNPEKLKGLGEIKTRVDENGNTTYSIGPFKSLLEAEIFKYKVADKDTSLHNVLVTILDKGKRKIIQQYYATEYSRRDYVKPTDTKVIKKKDNVIALNSGESLKNLQKDEGKSEIAGLTYKVEIGTVDNPADFKLQYLEKYGKIESKKYPDGKTRYTFGSFKTLAEAEAFKKSLVEKEAEAAKAFVTVFFFGARKTLEEHLNPCNPNAPTDFAYFVGKDLNDKAVYAQLIEQAGNNCAEGLVFRVQIGAYRMPKNFKHKNLNSLEPPPALVTPYPDGITRFTMREFTTIKDAEAFRQECIRLGTTDAWITAMYQGKRMLLQELIANNFFNKKIN